MCSGTFAFYTRGDCTKVSQHTHFTIEGSFCFSILRPHLAKLPMLALNL